jgi:enoyl-CoA hydratase
MSQDILVEQDGAILRLTLNRPDDGNAMSDEMAVEFAGIVNRAHETSDFIVLRASGKDFCIGRARGKSAGPPPAPPEAYQRRSENDVIFNCYLAMRRSAIPVVGVIQGRTMGFGTAIAALCDVSFASDAATFNIPELEHNIMPTMVLSSLFDRVPRNAIAYLTYSTDFVDAQRALTYGIISQVVPAAKLEETVADFCRKMLQTPRPAIVGVKEYLRVAPNMDAQGGVDYARSLHAIVNTSSEMKKKSRAKAH